MKRRNLNTRAKTRARNIGWRRRELQRERERKHRLVTLALWLNISELQTINSVREWGEKQAATTFPAIHSPHAKTKAPLGFLPSLSSFCVFFHVCRAPSAANSVSAKLPLRQQKLFSTLKNSPCLLCATSLISHSGRNFTFYAND
jgi:hypothetical protein